MDLSRFNAKYNFTLSGINFSVDIDDSLSAAYRAKKYPPADKKTLHSHPLHELFFIFEDGIKITFENDSQEYKNGILAIPPNAKHFTWRTSDYRLLFSCSTKEKSKDKLAAFFTEKIAQNNIYFIPIIKSEMRVYLEELFYLFKNQKNTVAKEVVTAILKIIFFHVFIYNEPLEKDNEYSEESRYITISQIITQSTTPGNTVSLQSIAETLNLSPKQASRMIYKYYGASLPAVITEEKLGYAAYLLTTTALPVAEIAYECNFSNENYFYLQFKKRFGCTPLRYRKQNQNPGSPLS